MEHLYLDYSASTPIRKEVITAMMHVFESEYGNPSSIHERGRAAKKILEAAREAIGLAIGASAKEITLTGSGTEANNLAIFGFMAQFRHQAGHVITSQIEHPAVLNCFRELEDQGFAVTYLPVSRDGVIQVEDVRSALQDDTRFVSMMLANNEVGTIQPVKEIAQLCHERGIVIHTDAIQAVGKIPVNVIDLDVDMLTFSPHKMYGPKGVGVLYKRRRTRLTPIVLGGGQERGLRSGTENFPLIHGASVAVSLAVQEMDTEMIRRRGLRDAMKAQVLATIPDVMVTSGDAETLPHVLHVSVAGVLGEALLLELDRLGVHVSAGSACSAGTAEPSYVLSAMGVPESHIHGAIRISLGKPTCEADVDRLVNTLDTVVKSLRKMVGM